MAVSRSVQEFSAREGYSMVTTLPHTPIMTLASLNTLLWQTFGPCLVVLHVWPFSRRERHFERGISTDGKAIFGIYVHSARDSKADWIKNHNFWAATGSKTLINPNPHTPRADQSLPLWICWTSNSRRMVSRHAHFSITPHRRLPIPAPEAARHLRSLHRGWKYRCHRHQKRSK